MYVRAYVVYAYVTCVYVGVRDTCERACAEPILLVN